MMSFPFERRLLGLTAFLQLFLTGSAALDLRNSPYDGTSVYEPRDTGHGDGRLFDFVTRPDIGAPKWDITIIDDSNLAPGYWFVAPYAELDQVDYPLWNGPHIYRTNGELVWSGAPMFEHFNTFDFRTVTVGGEKKLSLINPEDKHRSGVIMDNNYNISHAVDLRGELDSTNMHDFTVVDDGERALTCSKVLGRSTVEESKVVGFDGECKAGWEGFRELDVATSEIVFDWNPHGHVSLDESTKITGPYEKMCNNRWDILHLNSIDKFPDGDYLLSSRHTDAIFKISHRDGSIVWRLGGVKSDFDIAKEAKFSRQHHARVHEQNETHTMVSLFDNARGDGEGEHKSNPFSRGLLLSLRTDTKPMTAEMFRHYDHPNRVITNSRGSLEFLPNGNAFLGWTYGSLLSEHSSDGKLLMKAHSKLGAAHTYRAYKLPWVGYPSQPPDVRAEVKMDGDKMQMIIHMSQNGATEISTWKVFNANIRGEKGDMVASGPCQGFESMLRYKGYSKFVVAEAYDSKGHLLASSLVTGTITEPGMKLPLVGDDPKIHRGLLQDPLSAYGFVLGVTVCIVGYCGVRIILSLKRSGFLKWRPKRLRYAPVNTGEEGEEPIETRSLVRGQESQHGSRTTSPRYEDE